MSLRKQTEITSADSKLIGFDYQYLYFIVRLLQLSPGEEIGYERLDDVDVISAPKQTAYFYQLKHTTQTTASGEQANLTDLSTDFWKTLSNWSKLITDAAEGRNKQSKQKAFIAQAKFEFVANRNGDKNELLIQIEKLKAKEINRKQYMQYVKDLQERTKDETLKEYMQNVIDLGETVLALFMQNVDFLNAPDDLFAEVRDQIRNKMILDEYVDSVFAELLLELKEEFFKKVRKGEHQVITYSEWLSKYCGIFNGFRTTSLPFRQYDPVLPEHLEQQTFVKELIEIAAVDMEDNGLAAIADWTNSYLTLKMQLEQWHEDGRVSNLAIQKFHEMAKKTWINIHRAAHRKTARNESLDIENALNCFDDVMKEKMQILQTDLEVQLSNGEFIQLADKSEIGWKYSWKDKYYADRNECSKK